MIDRIAKALHDKMAEGAPGPKRYWETAPKEVKDAMRSYAEAILDVMEEPTPGMLEAADSIIPVGFLWGTSDEPSGTRIIWRAMIRHGNDKDEYDA